MSIRGVNIAAYPLSRNGAITTIDTFKSAFDEIQAAGGNAVAINPVEYCLLREGTPIISKPPPEWLITRMIFPDVGQGSHSWPQSISPDLVHVACGEARSRGLTVMLKPMIDPYAGGWRGYISIKGVDAAGKPYDLSYPFKLAYNRFLREWAEVAIGAKVDIFCIGTEFYQITKEMGGAWWGDRSEYVARFGYRGNTTYAANWGGACDDAEFWRISQAGGWSHFDHVGIDGYFPLAGLSSEYVGVPEYEQAVFDGWHSRSVEADWCMPHDEAILRASAGASEPLMFTEIGYRADEGAALDPWADPGSHALNVQAQLACLRAFRRKWPNTDYFMWDFSLYPGLADPRSHNLRGKPEALRVALAETWE